MVTVGRNHNDGAAPPCADSAGTCIATAPEKQTSSQPSWTPLFEPGLPLQQPVLFVFVRRNRQPPAHPGSAILFFGVVTILRYFWWAILVARLLG